MAIDNCRHSFGELAASVLPKHMARLHAHMKNPIAMSEFGEPGAGTARILTNLNLKHDFHGCYVLMEDKKPLYVGISQKVVQRLQQHIKGKTHYDASLAYRMASSTYPQDSTRSEAMQSGTFLKAFTDAKRNLQELNVAFVAINNALELYLFEPYCAMEFNTSKWNTFETH